MDAGLLLLKSAFGWSINPNFYRYCGGSAVPCVHYTHKYPHGVITERAKSVKGKIAATVIKELLKNEKPSPIAICHPSGKEK